MTNKKSLEQLLKDFENNTGRKPSIPAYITATITILLITILVLSWLAVLFVTPVYLVEIMLQAL